MATMLFPFTRTTVSDSLMSLEASGSLKAPRLPRSRLLVFSVTTLTEDECAA